jgi:hypothetical protein
MEFHLVYAGELLKAAGYKKTRAWEKHQIRRYFHPQLKRLWETHPVFRFYAQPKHIEHDAFASGIVTHHTTIDAIAKHWEGYVPVVNGDWGMFCDLDILFLRAEPLGNVIKRDAGGGDLDNRIKTLLDALSIPNRGTVRLKEGDTPDPNPMFVLLSDDSLVTSVKVNSDRLLTTATDDPAETCLVIHVNVKTVDPLSAPYGLTV